MPVRLSLVIGFHPTSNTTYSTWDHFHFNLLLECNKIIVTSYLYSSCVFHMSMFNVFLFELFWHVAMVVCLCDFWRNRDSYNVRQTPVTLLKFVIEVLLASIKNVTWGFVETLLNISERITHHFTIQKLAKSSWTLETAQSYLSTCRSCLFYFMSTLVRENHITWMAYRSVRKTEKAC